MKMNDILEANKKVIDDRLEAGMALLQEHYRIAEREVDPKLADTNIGGRPHHARCFDIEGVGNLLLMTVKEAEEYQLSSFVITPYAKNLPLLSTDYVYSGEKRFFLMEIYDLSVTHDKTYEDGIESFKTFGERLDGLPDFPVKAGWYDDIRPVCYAKAPGMDQDEEAIGYFLELLELFVKMEQASPLLSGGELAAKWEKNRDYADRLIDEGGVSTDLFTQALGPEDTRRFFHEVFFGPANYRE